MPANCNMAASTVRPADLSDLSDFSDLSDQAAICHAAGLTPTFGG